MLNVTEDFIELHLIDLGTMISTLKGILGDDFLGELTYSLHEFGIDLLMDEQSGTGNTTLTHVVHNARPGKSDGLINIGIRTNNNWGLST